MTSIIISHLLVLYLGSLIDVSISFFLNKFLDNMILSVLLGIFITTSFCIYSRKESLFKMFKDISLLVLIRVSTTYFFNEFTDNNIFLLALIETLIHMILNYLKHLVSLKL